MFHHQIAVTLIFILYDKLAIALDNDVTFAGQVLFEKEHPDFSQAGGDSWRTNRLARFRSTRSTTYGRQDNGKTISYFELETNKS